MMLLHVIVMKVLDLTLSASVLVMVVLALRRFGAGWVSPRVIRWLWLILLVKLAVPFNVPSPFSIENWTDTLFYHHPYSVNRALEAAGDGWNEAQEAWANHLVTLDSGYPSGRTEDGITADKAGWVPDPAVVKLRRQSDGFQSILTGAGLIWLGGFIVTLTLGAIRSRKARRLAANALPCEDMQVLSLFQQCKEVAGVKQNVRLMVSGTIYPVLYGLFKPRILIPYDYTTLYDVGELRHILLHELNHAKQYDIAILRLSGLMQAVYWFNPLIRHAIGKIRDDVEISCDARVLRRMNAEEQLLYGMLLIKQGELNHRFVHPDYAGAHWAAGRSQLKERILKIAGYASFKRGKLSSFISAGVLVLMCGCFLTGNSLYAEGDGSSSANPTLYVFWLAGDANPQSMAVIDSISNQMTGTAGPDQEAVLLLKEDVVQSAFRKTMDKLESLSGLKADQPVVIQTNRIQEELGRRGLNTGRLWVTLKHDYTYIKAFTIGSGRSTMVDLTDSGLSDEIEL
jgi:beta-lactamase regulating signal transducer with metallopeptidase domain